MNELYEELYTPEGERKISRIAQAKAFAKNNQIKDEQRVVLKGPVYDHGKMEGMERITGWSLRMECQMMVYHNESAGMR